MELTFTDHLFSAPPISQGYLSPLINQGWVSQFMPQKADLVLLLPCSWGEGWLSCGLEEKSILT